MKTTLPDGRVTYVYEDSDLDDEILPGKPNLVRITVFCFVVGMVVVFGVASIFYFW